MVMPVNDRYTHLYADVLYIEVAGCSSEVGGVERPGGLDIADHPCSVQCGSSCHYQLTSVILQNGILLWWGWRQVFDVLV